MGIGGGIGGNRWRNRWVCARLIGIYITTKAHTLPELAPTTLPPLTHSSDGGSVIKCTLQFRLPQATSGGGGLESYVLHTSGGGGLES